MLWEWYKKANEDIPVNEALKERLKQKAAQPQKPALYKKVYPLGAAVAGILIVAATVWVYPMFTEYIDHPFGTDGSPSVITQSSDWTPITSAAPTETKEPAVQKEQNIAVQQSAPASPKPTQTSKPARTEKPVSNQTENPEQEPTAPRAESPEPSAVLQVPAEIDEKSGENPASGGQPLVKGVTSDADAALETAVWTRQDYVEYLGMDLSKILKLPEEFTEVSAESKPMSLYVDTKLPYYDVWSFKYEAADGRSIVVKTTKAQAEPIEYPNRKINGMDVLITGKGTEFTAELLYNGIRFTVKTQGLSEQELEDICELILTAEL